MERRYQALSSDTKSRKFVSYRKMKQRERPLEGVLYPRIAHMGTLCIGMREPVPAVVAWCAVYTYISAWAGCVAYLCVEAMREPETEVSKSTDSYAFSFIYTRV